MLRSTWGCITAVLLAAGPAYAADTKYSIKIADTPAPKELKEPIRKLLGERSIQLLDDKEAVVAELWFRKELPAKATPEQVKNGLTYRELEETTLLGAVRFDRMMTDYRKQKVKPGVYTLRLGFQPMDGDHMGTAPHNEFCLLIPAALDEKPDVLEVKETREQSSKSHGGTHPGVWLLFPNEKPQTEPKLVDKANGHWALLVKCDAKADGATGELGLGLTLIGHTSAE